MQHGALPPLLDIRRVVENGEARIRNSTLPLVGLPPSWTGNRSVGRTEWTESSEPGDVPFELIELLHGPTNNDASTDQARPDALSVTVMSGDSRQRVADLVTHFGGVRKYAPAEPITVRIDDFLDRLPAYRTGDYVVAQTVFDGHVLVLKWPRTDAISDPLVLTRVRDLTDYLAGRRRHFRDAYPQAPI